jgi:3-hydroxyacyl-[acyl-carrier-protein] dehydratase
MAALQPPLGAEQIKAIIPHRFPFLLLDRVIELEAGKRVVGLKQVSLSDPFLQGHFPDYPVMPGVLIVEALAQAGAVLVLSDPAYAGQIPFFARIDNCRFRQPVRPGDTLRVRITIEEARRSRSKPDRGLVRGRVEVFNQNDELVLSMRPMNLVRCRTPAPPEAATDRAEAAGR